MTNLKAQCRKDRLNTRYDMNLLQIRKRSVTSVNTILATRKVIKVV